MLFQIKSGAMKVVPDFNHIQWLLCENPEWKNTLNLH